MECKVFPKFLHRVFVTPKIYTVSLVKLNFLGYN